MSKLPDLIDAQAPRLLAKPVCKNSAALYPSTNLLYLARTRFTQGTQMQSPNSKYVPPVSSIRYTPACSRVWCHIATCPMAAD